MKTGLRSELLVLLLTISLGPLLIATGVSWWAARAILEAELSQSLRAIATRQSFAMNAAVRSIELQTERLSTTDGLVNALVAFESNESREAVRARIAPEMEDLLGLALADAKFDNAYLIDRRGRILYSQAQPEEEGQVLSESQPYSELTRVVDRSRTILETELSDIRPDLVSSRPVCYSATPVFLSGRLVGVLALKIDSDRLLGGVENYTGLGRTGEIVVASTYGEDVVLVAPLRRDPNAAFRVRVPTGGAVKHPLEQAVRGGRGSGLTTDHRGTGVLAVWRYIPALRLGIVVKIDRDEAFDAVDRLGIVVLSLLAATGLLVPLIAFHQASRLALPILKLRDLSRDVASGRFDTPVSIRTRNEIADLAVAFDDMRRRLQEYIRDLRTTTSQREEAAREAIEAKGELERINQHLESLVEERTRELRERNGQLELTLADLRRTQEQLIVREKMASLGELTSGVAHEISNPLNFVANFTDLSIDALDELRSAIEPEAPKLTPKAIDEYEEAVIALTDNLERVQDHSRRAQRIVQSMIELTRGSTGERRPIELNMFMQEISRTAIQAARSRESLPELGLDFQLVEQPIMIDGFVSELSRAFINVIGNAATAVAERAREAASDYVPMVRIMTQDNTDEAVVIVRDNGVGIQDANIKKIFQPFFTTRPTGRGSTGLGLSMTWEVIVSQHGGRIEVESDPGQYTEFRFILPKSAQNAAGPEED